MEGWVLSPATFAQLPSKCRPTRVWKYDPALYAFTFNQPITGTPQFGENHILLQRPGGLWIPAEELVAIIDNTALFLTAHVDYVRWRIVGKPDLLECAVAPFKYPIGGPIPYSRDWDA